jgi:hypothetical protein
MDSFFTLNKGIDGRAMLRTDLSTPVMAHSELYRIQ